MGRGGEKTKNIKSPTITEFMKAQNQAYFNNEKLKFYNFIPDIEKEYNVNYPPTLKRWDGLRASTDVPPE